MSKLSIFFLTDFENIGCFIDDDHRILRGAEFKNQKEMSAKICYEKCYVERQFTYFATEVLN